MPNDALMSSEDFLATQDSASSAILQKQLYMSLPLEDSTENIEALSFRSADATHQNRALDHHISANSITQQTEVHKKKFSGDQMKPQLVFVMHSPRPGGRSSESQSDPGITNKTR